MDAQKMCRRQLLKGVLAFGAAFGTASFLPEKWIKPVIRAGVLPAHAQASNACQQGLFGRLFYYESFEYPGSYYFRLEVYDRSISELTYQILSMPDIFTTPPHQTVTVYAIGKGYASFSYDAVGMVFRTGWDPSTQPLTVMLQLTWGTHSCTQTFTASAY